MKNATFTFLAGILLTACSNQTVQKTNDGVIVTIPQTDQLDVHKVRLQVVGDKIIRVTATPDKDFSDAKSLIIVPQTATPEFQTLETDSNVTLKTAVLQAKVNLKNGVVSFCDLDGNPILSEDGAEKSFQSIEVEGTKAYSVRDVFLTDSTEGLYGLGQHQADEFNYKGKNEELFQYNTKVSVPFIVSTRNYGVLWDSYSLLRFGDPRDYAQLNRVFKLYDKDGKEGALTGTYTPSKESGKDILVRREDSIYYENLKTIKNLPREIPLKGAKVVYEGDIEPSESGLFRFLLYYAGYTKVFLDGKEVIAERWRTAWNPNSHKFEVNLEAGKRVPLRIEWLPDGGDSYCGLRVLTPVPAEEQNKLAFWGEMQKLLDYYFVAGNNMDDVISGYRTLTGKAPVMPKWAMGYWQSREKYGTQDEILSTLKEFRNRQVPIDNIVQDWFYWKEDQWGSHEFDPARYPDPQAMIDSIHAMHGHYMISVWPKFYCNTDHYKEFDKNGWMYQQAVKDSIRDWVGKGYVGSFYDAYSADARKLFWNQMNEHLYKYGIDAWWMDASEPNVRDCTDMPYRKALCGPTALGPSAEYFNAYALMNAEAIYDGQRSVKPNNRVFLLTRSGFAGLQRYSTATWSGDIATRWEDMKAQISAGLNIAMSGVPYWTMDIGGFCVEDRYVAGQMEFNKTGRENSDYKEWRELNARWYQFGAFCPLYRAHGQYPYREIWNIAPQNHPAYQSILYYTKLRYNLMPYIYSMAGMTYFDDYTIMRALAMDYTYDRKVFNIGDQFMFGPSLMVAPVYTYGARNRDVYFPSQKVWYDFYTGKAIEGGQTLNVPAPYERVPLFAHAGSILTFGPDMQYSDEKKADNITLYIYKGADGQFKLYEDEGTNYNYEKGAYSVIPLTYNDATQTLTIGDREGQFDGMLKNRTFNVIVVSKEKAQPFDLNAKGVEVNYNGKAISVKI